MPKKKIAIFTSVEGHLSIAQALEEILAPHYDVVQFQDRTSAFNIYLLIYRTFPSAMQLPYDLSQKPSLVALLEKSFRAKYRKKIRAFFDQHQPDICFNTYFMFNPALEEICQERHIPFYNILTDPGSIHPLLLAEKAVANFAFDDETIRQCQALDRPCRLLPLGWLVRQRYYRQFSKEAAQQKLGLKPKYFTILITSGSEGTYAVTKILPALIMMQRPLQIIVSCGSNKALLSNMKSMAKMVQALKTHHRLIPLAFTTELNIYMQAADLILGKAGPNTLFEAVATETPFFAISHMGGQEKGNLEIIPKYHLGYVEENTTLATKMLQEIIEHPAELEKFREPLKKLAAYNAASKEKLLTILANG